jgi:hypothetical protein
MELEHLLINVIRLHLMQQQEERYFLEQQQINTTFQFKTLLEIINTML